MCGIAGFFGKNFKRNEQEQVLDRMLATLRHRGPDGWGVYHSNNISLGHTRLSIIDLACGDQPMLSDRYVLVYNGEVYNYKELRAALQSKGHTFATSSDTEVVLRSIEEYGTDAFTQFNGQFALLAWDKKEKKLIMARDRYGMRPLYILEDNERFFFSSEIKAFDTLAGFNRSFNIDNLFEHCLLWNTLDDRTVFNNIQSLPSGCHGVLTHNSPLHIRRYYQIGESAPSENVSYESVQANFKDLLNDSVRLRLQSDVPVGAYLSGGIDSSITSYLTNELNRERLKTFSVSFADKEFDESVYQNEMISILKCDHHDANINYETIEKHFLDAAYHFERPLFRTAPLPLYMLSQEVSNNNIKVVLTGEGADEVLFGYDAYKELKLLTEWKHNRDSGHFATMIKQLYPHLLHYNDPKQAGFIRMYYESFLDDIDNDLLGLNIRIANNKIMAGFFNKDYNITYDREKVIENTRAILPDNFNGWSCLQKNQFLEMKTLLQGYLLSSQGDRMSMGHSVEGRYPFLDHRLVEMLFYANDDYKLNGYSQKFLLCDSYKDIIPDSIINRPKKPYTAPDLKAFIQNNTLTERTARFLSEQAIIETGIFDTKMVTRFLNKFSRGVPEKIGYRDNMIFIILLSCQMIDYWMKNRADTAALDPELKKIAIFDY